MDVLVLEAPRDGELCERAAQAIGERRQLPEAGLLLARVFATILVLQPGVALKKGVSDAYRALADCLLSH